MTSGVADRELGEALETARAALAAARECGVEPVDGRDAIALARAVEELRRDVDALGIEVMDAVDRRGLHKADGHSSAKAFVRHHLRLSNAEASARDKTMRVMRDLPQVAAAYRSGELGTDQVRLLGRLHANRRVRDAMVERQGWFLAKAAGERSYRDFELVVRRWERLNDEDGPEPNDRANRNRNANIVQNDFDLTWTLFGRFGAFQGATIREIWDHYYQAETETDWEKARVELGDAATVMDLPRTDGQRRADAFYQIFQDAVCAPGSATPPDYVHNIVWSAETYEEMLRRLDGEAPEPVDVDTHQCETMDGTPVEPTEAAVLSLLHQVRRVLVDARSLVIDQGRARCFTGSARTAVRLTSTRCMWPGCHVPTTRCEIDHLHDHARGGPTNPDNGGNCCGRHNRWLQKGFSVSRDPTTGEILIFRPDGTQLE